MKPPLAVVASAPGSILRQVFDVHAVTSLTGDWASVRTILLGMVSTVGVLAIDEGLGGPEVLRELRDAGFVGRVVYVTSRQDPLVHETAKQHGADTVIARADLELIFQLASPARKNPTLLPAPSRENGDRVVIAELEFDRRLGRLWVNGHEICLTHRPWQALDYLIRHRGRIVPTVELGKEAFTEVLDASTVRDHLRELRRSLGDARRLIQTPRRGGYLLA